MSEAMVEQIRQRLTRALAPTELEIVDEGHLHAGHAGEGKGHFHVRIVSAAFAGLLPIRRHRLVYAALDGLMDQNAYKAFCDGL